MNMYRQKLSIHYSVEDVWIYSGSRGLRQPNMLSEYKNSTRSFTVASAWEFAADACNSCHIPAALSQQNKNRKTTAWRGRMDRIPLCCAHIKNTYNVKSLFSSLSTNRIELSSVGDDGYTTDKLGQCNCAFGYIQTDHMHGARVSYSSSMHVFTHQKCGGPHRRIVISSQRDSDAIWQKRLALSLT